MTGKQWVNLQFPVQICLVSRSNPYSCMVEKVITCRKQVDPQSWCWISKGAVILSGSISGNDPGALNQHYLKAILLM